MQELFNIYNHKIDRSDKGLVKIFTDSDSLFKGFEYAHRNKSMFEERKNARNITTKLVDEHNSFTEIDAKTLISNGYGQKINYSFFNTEKEKLKEFSQKLKETLSPIAPQRLRKNSEYDGEYSFDRRDEIEPFQACFKTKTGLMPTLTINIDFNFSAYQTAEKISQFGSFCHAIISKIEESGVSCEVNFVQHLHSLFPHGKESGLNHVFYTNLKQAGSYIEESTLARCFTSGFYRRACFLNWLTYAEKLKLKACDGLGYYKEPPTNENTLLLSFKNQLDNPDKLAQEIINKLKKGN